MQEQDEKVRDRLGEEIDCESQPLQKEEEVEAPIKLNKRTWVVN